MDQRIPRRDHRLRRRRHYQYFTKRLRSCDFSRFLAERLKSLLRFRDLLIILEMNDKAAKTFEKDGGYKLIGMNMLDCHPDPAREKTERLLAAQVKNVYTIEKNGVKKMIFQSPWYKESGTYAGFVELSLEIPFEMPHFIRT